MKYLLIFFILLAVSCQKEKPEKYGFYYWRSDFKLNKVEQTLLQKSTSDDFYVRIFDIDKQNNSLVVVGKSNFKADIKNPKKLVPVVFITNHTWVNATEKDVMQVAKQQGREIDKIKISSPNVFDIDQANERLQAIKK